MFAKIAKRLRSDIADSSVVTFVFILPLFFSFLVTIVDSSIYFSNRSVIQQVARDGVRQAAIFGGPGTATVQSKIEQEYGYSALADSTAPNCAPLVGTVLVRGNDVECQIYKRLVVNSGLTNIEVGRVNCGVGPTQGGSNRAAGLSNLISFNERPNGLATSTGDVITCQILWKYPGVPGSAMAFLRAGDGTGNGYYQDTRVTAQTETSVNGTSIVAR